MSIGKQRRLKRVVELINSKSWLFTLVTGAVQAGVWNLLPGTELAPRSSPRVRRLPRLEGHCRSTPSMRMRHGVAVCILNSLLARREHQQNDEPAKSYAS